MRKFILAMLCILFLVIDNSIMPFLAIKGVQGSLLFSFIICYSIIAGSWEALGMAVFAGLMQDVYMIKGLGINALTNMIICLIAAKIGEGIFKEKRFVPVVVVALGSMLRGILIFIFLYLTKQRVDLVSLILSSIYNLIIAIFMYKKVFNLMQKPFMKKDWNF